MGSRERRRAERRKRKERGAHRPRVPEPSPPSRSELKNQQAREALEPLRRDERPLVVTIGAIVSALLAASIVVAYLAGAEVNGEPPPVAQVIVPALLMGIMAFGMWRARYWAVLGFQVVLLILIIATALGTVQATSATQVIGNALVLAISGTFFYFMIKALARIQMPERLPRE
jgi:glyoxylate carboligase